jgi:hypothetical protein
VREQAALAHTDGIGEPAQRQAVEPLDGREPRGLLEDRLTAALAVAAALSLCVRLRTHR